MNIWKKVLVGTVSMATLGGGAAVATTAASASPGASAHRAIERQLGNDRGRQVEARGRLAEGEREAGDDRGTEVEARGRNHEGEAELEANDDRGAVHQAGRDDNRGPSPSSGHGGRDDGPDHR
jgi:hypothetical protein